MTIRILLLVTAVATLISTQGTLRAVEPPPKPAEYQVLEKLIGDWTSQWRVTVQDAKPHDLKLTGVAVRVMRLDGRLVEETGKSSNGEEFRILFTYDLIRKAYRFYHFSASGVVIDMAGQWDDAAQTFFFKADLGNGFSQVTTIHFTDNDNHEWVTTATDAAGKIYFAGVGKLTRNKRGRS